MLDADELNRTLVRLSAATASANLVGAFGGVNFVPTTMSGAQFDFDVAAAFCAQQPPPLAAPPPPPPPPPSAASMFPLLLRQLVASKAHTLPLAPAAVSTPPPTCTTTIAAWLSSTTQSDEFCSSSVGGGSEGDNETKSTTTIIGSAHAAAATNATAGVVALADAAPMPTRFHGRHSIWRYFQVLREESVYHCSVENCFAAYAWPPSTTVAGRHLRDKHPHMYRRVFIILLESKGNLDL